MHSSVSASTRAVSGSNQAESSFSLFFFCSLPTVRECFPFFFFLFDTMYVHFRCCSCHIDNNSTLLSRCITSYDTRRCAVGTRTYKKFSCFISWHSSGRNFDSGTTSRGIHSYPGTERYYFYGMWPPWDVFVRERGLHFSVGRERDIRICAGRVCTGTGFHIFQGTTGVSRIPHKNRGIYG